MTTMSFFANLKALAADAGKRRERAIFKYRELYRE